MPTLKAGRHYINKNKNSKHIAEITPLTDLEVSQKLYNDFVETKNGEPVKKKLQNRKFKYIFKHVFILEGKMSVFDNFIGESLKEFLGEFKVSACECSVGYKLECDDGRMFVAENTSKLLDAVESAYNEYLKAGKTYGE